MKRSIFFGVALVFAANLAPRAQQRHEVHLGSGAMSCGQWLSLREGSKPSDSSDDKANNLILTGMATSWVQGFIVAAGGYVAEDKRDAYLQAIPDGSSIQPWLDKYCREQPPTRTVLAAASALNSQLRSQVGGPAR